MSVDPKWNIVRPDDGVSFAPQADEPSDLPPDLQSIADRLTDEAASLSARFPASTLTDINKKFTNTRIRFAAAMMGIALGGAGFGWWLHGSSDRKNGPIHAVAAANSTEAAPRPPSLPPLPDPSVNPAGIEEVAYVPRDPKSSKLSEVDMLRIQLSAFEEVIRRLQNELSRRAQSEAETANTIESLRSEIEQLRQQLSSQRQPQSDTP